MRPRIDIRTTRGLALALPIEPGDRVGVHGEGIDPLVAALRATGAVPDEHLDGDDSLAHAIVVLPSLGGLTSTASPLLGRLRPGGTMVVAVTVRADRRRGHAQTVARLAAWANGHGTTLTGSFGIRQHLGDIRHLVPLEGPALRWYLRTQLLAWSPRAGQAARIGAHLAPTGVLHRAFPAVAVTLRREEAPA